LSRIGKVLAPLALIFIIFTQAVSAEYVYDIDNTIVDQIYWDTKIERNEYRSRVSEYLMLPTADECLEWEIDPEILEDMEPFPTNFNGINNQMISLMERYWKRAHYLSGYDLRSAICAFNFITTNPGHDYRIILNYPVDGRKYTFLNMNLFEMDYQEIIRMRKFRGINVDVRRGMIDDTVKFFHDWTPIQFNPPVIPQDYGWFPAKKRRHDYETRQHYGWVNTLKEESYIFYLESKEKRGADTDWPVLRKEVMDEILGVRLKDSEFYDENYDTKIWRQATYSSRWHLADIMNGLVGSINNNELRRTEVILKPVPKVSSRDTVRGVLLISEIMNKLEYKTAVPSRSEVERVLRFSRYIIAVANGRNYFRYDDQYAFHLLREEIKLVYGEIFEDTAWRHTVAYLVTANAVQ
jgi:hypothetical protein